MRKVFSRLSAVFICAQVVACGAAFAASDSVIMPGLVKNFELPNFDPDSGFKDWEVFGSTARYVGEKIVITDLKLDLYDGKKTQVKRATFKSPLADVYPDLNEGGSNEKVEISGDGFNLTGKRWLWSGKQDKIDIYSDVVLDISGKKPEDKTQIKSVEATFSTGSEENSFDFRKNVSVVNAQAKTLCDVLEVRTLKNAEGKSAQEGVKHIEAKGNVKFDSDGRKSTSGYAKIIPADDLVVLLEKPSLFDEASKASLSGARIEISKAKNTIKSFSDANTRSTAIIVDESDSSAPDTIFISSKEALLSQPKEGFSEFSFEGDVKVTSSKFKAEADSLMAHASPSKSGGSEITKIEGLGDVRLFKDSRTASAKRLEVFPAKGETWLTDSARLEEREKGMTLESKSIILLQNSQTALAISDKKNPKDFVVVTLSGGMEDLDPSVAAGKAGGNSKTVIKSRNLKSVKKGEANILSFTGDVGVSSEGMNSSCQVMDVYADSVDAEGGSAAIRQIVAAKDVVVTHEDYVAKSQIAYIFPKVEADSKSGKKPAETSHRFVEMLISPDKPEERPSIILPHMDGVGLEKSQMSADSPQGGEPTRIVSNRQSLVGGTKADRYFFEGDVEITGDGVKGSCDRIEVVMLKPQAGAQAQSKERGIDKIILFGNVKMEQGLKVATCGRADVYPKAGTVVMTDNPVVINNEDNTRAEGPRIVYVNGTKGVRIEPMLEEQFNAIDDSQTPPKRPTLLLPAIGTKD